MECYYDDNNNNNNSSRNDDDDDDDDDGDSIDLILSLHLLKILLYCNSDSKSAR